MISTHATRLTQLAGLLFHVDAAESKMLRATGSGAPDKTRREVNSKLSLALSLRAVEFRIFLYDLL